MNASELRIGSLVWDVEQKEVDKIVGIEEKRVSVEGSTFTYTPIDEILPIELTEEWLLKFGFKKYSHDPIFSIDSDEADDKCDEYCKGSLSIMDWGRGFILSNSFSFKLRVELKYVHQFQNLYFCLTGEELKIS